MDFTAPECYYGALPKVISPTFIDFSSYYDVQTKLEEDRVA